MTQAYAQLAAVRNVETSPEQMNVVLSYLEGEDWTIEEFKAACKRIATDPAIAKQVGYNGCLTPDVFTMARENAKPDLGRCFGPYCGHRATVAAWGEVYCEGCYAGHKAASNAYQDRLDADMVRAGLRSPEHTRRAEITEGEARQDGISAFLAPVSEDAQ